jgi:hypothetical protein
MKTFFQTASKRREAKRHNFHPMRNRAFRPIAAILSVLLLAAVPASAGPVGISEVIQVLGSSKNPPVLMLRGTSPDSNELAFGTKGPLQAGAFRQTLSNNSLTVADTSSTGPRKGTTDSLLSGVSVTSDEGKVGIEVINLGDVEGTVCDCGEIAVGGGGFPKWPLLFLAAIPFAFIHDCDDCDKSTPNPTPNPTLTPNTPTSIPEPASLLLFGTGLLVFGGGLRRRYAKGKLEAQIEETEV